MSRKHEYPPSFGPDHESAEVRSAWAILDSLPVGELSRRTRFLLAGLIAGALAAAAETAPADRQVRIVDSLQLDAMLLALSQTMVALEPNVGSDTLANVRGSMAAAKLLGVVMAYSLRHAPHEYDIRFEKMIEVARESSEATVAILPAEPAR